MLRKTGFYLVVIAAIALGLLVGTLNASPVSLDLLWVQLELPLGLAILLGFTVGLLAGVSMTWLGRVFPLRLQLRKARSALSKQESTGLSTHND